MPRFSVHGFGLASVWRPSSVGAPATAADPSPLYSDAVTAGILKVSRERATLRVRMRDVLRGIVEADKARRARCIALVRGNVAQRNRIFALALARSRDAEIEAREWGSDDEASSARLSSQYWSEAMGAAESDAVVDDAGVLARSRAALHEATAWVRQVRLLGGSALAFCVPRRLARPSTPEHARTRVRAESPLRALSTAQLSDDVQSLGFRTLLRTRDLAASNPLLVPGEQPSWGAAQASALALAHEHATEIEMYPALGSPSVASRALVSPIAASTRGPANALGGAVVESAAGDAAVACEAVQALQASRRRLALCLDRLHYAASVANEIAQTQHALAPPLPALCTRVTDAAPPPPAVSTLLAATKRPPSSWRTRPPESHATHREPPRSAIPMPWADLRGRAALSDSRGASGHGGGCAFASMHSVSAHSVSAHSAAPFHGLEGSGLAPAATAEASSADCDGAPAGLAGCPPFCSLPHARAGHSDTYGGQSDTHGGQSDTHGGPPAQRCVASARAHATAWASATSDGRRLYFDEAAEASERSRRVGGMSVGTAVGATSGAAVGAAEVALDDVPGGGGGWGGGGWDDGGWGEDSGGEGGWEIPLSGTPTPSALSSPSQPKRHRNAITIAQS